MGKDDLLACLVEFLYAERKHLTCLCGSAVFLDEVPCGAVTFNAVCQGDDCALLDEVCNGSVVYRTYGVNSLIGIPGILFELLVAEAETTVCLVDFEDDNLEGLSDSGELRRMLDLLGPAQVADVHEAVNTFLKLYEYAEVGEVADSCGMPGVDGIFFCDGSPRIGFELLDTEGHLALLAVEGQDNSLNFVTDLEEVLCAAQVEAPAHFGDVDETLYAGLNLYECAVVSDDHDLTLDDVANLEVGIESIPGMRAELLETESDALLGVVEVEDDDIDLLVELDNLFGMADAAPGEVGNVDESVHSAEVHEYTVRADVLDGSLEYLTLLETADDLGLLGLELCLDESLVGNDHVAVFLIDLDDLELHRLVYIYVIITDGLDADLAAGEECLDSEYIDDHTALGAALDVALDDLVVVVSLVDPVPGTEGACPLVREDQLAFLVFRVLYEDIYLVTYCEVGVVAEFVDAHYALALVTYIDDNFALVHRDDSTFDHFVLAYAGKGLAVALFGSCLVGLVEAVILECVPVERCVVRRRVALSLGCGSRCGLCDLLCNRLFNLRCRGLYGLSCLSLEDLFVFNFVCHLL